MDRFLQAARELGYITDECRVYKGNLPLITFTDNVVKIEPYTLELAEEACTVARAIQKRLKDTPPAPWVIGTNPVYGRTARHPAGLSLALDKMTSSEWDDLIKLAEWAKTRNAP